MIKIFYRIKQEIQNVSYQLFSGQITLILRLKVKKVVGLLSQPIWLLFKKLITMQFLWLTIWPLKKSTKRQLTFEGTETKKLNLISIKNWIHPYYFVRTAILNNTILQWNTLCGEWWENRMAQIISMKKNATK